MKKGLEGPRFPQTTSSDLGERKFLLLGKRSGMELTREGLRSPLWWKG